MAAPLIVGLGNPGDRYRETRHNIGFQVVDRLLSGLEVVGTSRFLESELLEVRESPSDETFHCLKPGMFMNLSGSPVAHAMARHDIELAKMLVIFDDLDLPTGRVRLRHGGSSGGHRGVASIIDAVGADFDRLRIGIGRPVRDSHGDPGSATGDSEARGTVKDFVLERFDAEEEPLAEAARERAVAAVRCWLRHGIVAAMNEYNRALVAGDAATGRPQDDENGNGGAAGPAEGDPE